MLFFGIAKLALHVLEAAATGHEVNEATVTSVAANNNDSDGVASHVDNAANNDLNSDTTTNSGMSTFGCTIK